MVDDAALAPLPHPPSAARQKDTDRPESHKRPNVFPSLAPFAPHMDHAHSYNIYIHGRFMSKINTPLKQNDVILFNAYSLGSGRFGIEMRSRNGSGGKCANFIKCPPFSRTPRTMSDFGIFQVAVFANGDGAAFLHRVGPIHCGRWKCGKDLAICRCCCMKN